MKKFLKRILYITRKETIYNLEADIKTLQNINENLRKGDAMAVSVIEELTARIKVLEQTLAEKNDELNSKSLKVGELSAKIDIIENISKDIDLNDIMSMQAENASQKTEIKKLKKDLKTAKDLLKSLKEKNSEKVIK